MALPAGRYGVTKNQLLKIKKLPMNTIKLIEELTEKFDLLGSAAFKNSTSVVTDSTDLVESGAVKDIVGWENKNKLKMYPQTLTSGGLTAVISEDNVVLSGTYTGAGEFRLVKDRNSADGVLYLPYGTYVYSIDEYDANINLAVGTTAPNDNYWGIISSTNAKSVQFTLDANTNSKYNADGKVGIIMYIQTRNGQPTKNVFYPMICTAEEYAKSSAFEPYHESVEQTITQEIENALGYPLEKYSGADTVAISKSGTTSYTTDLVGGFDSGSKYKLSFDITAISGFNSSSSLRLQIYEKSDASVKILQSVNLTQAVGHYEIDFNPLVTLSDVSTLQIYIHSSETGTSATATLANISIVPPSVNEQKCDNSVIAPVENGATSSKAYAVGEHFIRDGAFCTCKQPISQGGSFTLNTNYTAGDVASFLFESGSIASVNLNNLTNTGRYWLAGSITNAPLNYNYGYLDIISQPDKTRVCQIFYKYDNAGKMYIRNLNSNVWSNWFEFSGTEIIP